MAAPAGGDAGGIHNLSASMEADELDQTFVESLRQRIQSKPITILREEAGSSSCCMHRVPPTLRQHDEKAYTPLAVSLGPFHHGNPMLQAMEEHKWRYLDKALSRATDEGLESFSRAIEGLAPKARECYAEIIHLENDEFVQMMVLDGCFIVQFVLIVAQFLSADTNDPIPNQSWLKSQIGRDIFFKNFGFFKQSSNVNPRHLLQSSNVTPRHLLHLLQLCALPDSIRLPTNPTYDVIPSATQLREAGVKFKCVNKNCFLDIIFEDGKLRIPALYIGHEICLLFLNLIAFEQCYTKYCDQYISAYLCFMNWLIHSADDVLILRREGIIENWLGSDEWVADLFKKLFRDVFVCEHYFYLSDVVKDINRYCCRPPHSWRANLIERYFYNPWGIISLIGAIILFLLTALQTFFAVFSYVKPPS